jgi:hypothetical protein
MATYRVTVKRRDGSVERVIARGKSARTAERIEDGVLINLNHDKYFVEVEEEVRDGAGGAE